MKWTTNTLKRSNTERSVTCLRIFVISVKRPRVLLRRWRRTELNMMCRIFRSWMSLNYESLLTNSCWLSRDTPFLYNISCVQYELRKVKFKYKPLPSTINYISGSSRIVFVPILNNIGNEIRDNIRGGLKDIDITAAKTLMINGELWCTMLRESTELLFI